MNTTKSLYDIIELNKMDKDQVRGLALQMSIPVRDEGKQTLIYAILEKQAEMNK